MGPTRPRPEPERGEGLEWKPKTQNPNRGEVPGKTQGCHVGLYERGLDSEGFLLPGFL